MNTFLELCNKPAGGELATAIREAVKETNSVQAGCNVHFIFRGSYVNTATGEHGCRHLIKEILAREPGLTTAAIIAKARKVNGFEKYPDTTFQHNLSNILAKNNEIYSVQTTGNGRRGRPVLRWFLSPANPAE